MGLRRKGSEKRKGAAAGLGEEEFDAPPQPGVQAPPDERLSAISFKRRKGEPGAAWDDMPWRRVDTTSEQLGEFEEAIFFELEELDGNAIIFNKKNSGSGAVAMVADSSDKDSNDTKRKEKSEKKKKEKKEKKEKTKEKSGVISPAPSAMKIDASDMRDGQWGDITLHGLLAKAVVHLGFSSPTPIQTATIAKAVKGDCDIVGAAETGSGKTLAFGLPILDFLLRSPAGGAASCKCPKALIIAPTRELASQISKVLKEVCDCFRDIRRINVVAITGGVAEQKQRRLLTVKGDYSIDILVATPGRLCELMKKDEAEVVESLQDLSRLRFLVVDEADRIVEEGHFKELNDVFGQVLADEKSAAAPSPRQTLLFSATAIPSAAEKTGSGIKSLPDHLRKLLVSVALKKSNLKICDVTKAAAVPSTSRGSKDSKSELEPAAEASSLPKQIQLFAVSTALGEKDLYAYNFITSNPGRILLFVNSVKTARRVDGVLKSLGVHCRAIHAQLQQKQRFKALEAFRAVPICVLIATDVAARGLDIPNIHHVIHYEIARSPANYIHRSGRTARANSAGTALSLVSPEDKGYHDAICREKGIPTISTYKFDLEKLFALKERVKLASDIYKLSFENARKCKEKVWLQQAAAGTGLEDELGDFYDSDGGHDGRRVDDDELNMSRADKRRIEEMKARLHVLSSAPADSSGRAGGAGMLYRKKAFVVVAK